TTSRKGSSGRSTGVLGKGVCPDISQPQQNGLGQMRMVNTVCIINLACIHSRMPATDQACLAASR
ncbi:MAG: hypothetical protein KJ740_23045, partial [Gammaproteobacteria bacterium]|nr:hypothetical protein [Gammaproteobacteria bacterium]